MAKPRNPVKVQTDPRIDQQLSAIRARGPQAICFFNNKGGVGKTTLVANLGAQLGMNLACKVLVVDADPQCNLTQYVLNDADFLEAYQHEDREPNSIYSVIHPLSMGKGYTQRLPIRKSKEFGFDIVIGDPRLALKEDLLAQDWRDAKAGGTRGLRTTFVFSDLVAKAKNYDFIFFDMGPSLGAINRSILLAAHYFVVPMSIDIFSMWAIENIGKALTVWRRELKVGLELAEDPTEIRNLNQHTSLNFLGYVTQQHKERTESGKRTIVEAYDTINRQLPEKIQEKLGPLYASAGMDAHLGDIKHLASLAPKSQTLHTPMINITTRGSYTSLRKQARLIYRGISERFIRNVAAGLNSRSR